ncbi:MAG: methyltransferase [Aquificota bacterium]|nr:methyltransferase [Aquificota bacterium]
MRGSGKEFTFFRGKLKLVQPEAHRVSVDLVLFLSKVRGVRRSSKVADLGAGFGFLSLVIAKKFGAKVFALERDGGMFRLLEENVKRNELSNLVFPVRCDVRRVDEFFKRGSFDVVVTNPPFFPHGKGDNLHSEGDTTLGDFLRASSYLLRDGGYLNLMIPSFRIYETFITLQPLNLPPRFMTLVYPKVSKPPKVTFITSIRNVPGPVHVDRPLIINTPEGRYTQEVEGVLEGLL